MVLAEKAEIPFAPVNKPTDLVDDLHMNESGSLAEVITPNGITAKLPKIPLRMDGKSFDLRTHPPKIGEGSLEVYRQLGFSEHDIRLFLEEGVIEMPDKEKFLSAAS